jgi:hypothetical protein
MMDETTRTVERATRMTAARSGSPREHDPHGNGTQSVWGITV